MNKALAMSSILLVGTAVGEATAAPDLDGTLRFEPDNERPVIDRANGRFVQTGLLRNVSSTPFAGPVSIALDNITRTGTSLALAESDGRLADGRDYYELLANVNLGAGASMPVEVPLVLENAMSRIAAMALEKLADRSVKAFDPPEQAAFSFSHDLFRVPAGNHPPVAKAGSDWTTGLGQAVALDGTGSSDRDGQPLAYRWTLVKAPSGSRAVLTDPTSAGTGLVPDVAGTYEASLVVNDGYLDSLPDTVSIVAAPGGATGQNRSPAINSTAATGATGTRAYAYQVLATDPDGDLLTYSLTKSPMGMKIDANTGKIDWTPPQPHHDGMLYPVEVTVSDGKGGETTQSFSISVKICTCA